MLERSRVRRFRRPTIAVVTLAALLGSTIAVTTHPAAATATFATVASAVTCATTGTTACQSYSNSSSGIAVSGTSNKGTGVRASSTSNYGVKSTSSTGTAIFGQVTSPSSSDTVAGVAGTSPSGFGVYGYTTKAGGGIGVNGVSQVVDGVSAGTPFSAGVAGTALQDGFGVYGASGSGDAVFGSSGSGTGGSFSGDFGVVAGGGSYPLVATDLSGNKLFYVDSNGNVFYHGHLSSFVHTKSGTTVSEFSARSSAPTIEDSGTAQLVGGTATVRLDPAFAATIETRTSYRVFVTPDGDTRGLFVASKTPQAFVVREVQGGRATLSFDYRILATSIGDGGKRMAAVSGSDGPSLPMTPRERTRVVRLPMSSDR